MNKRVRIDGVRYVNILAGTPGENRCGGLDQLGQCVVAADLYDADAPPGLEVKTGSTVTFNSLGQYSVDGGPATSFQPGQPIVANGFELVLRGVPTDGDTFTISPATAADASQNFGNARAILGLRDAPSFGGVSLGDGYIPVFSTLANKVQAGRMSAEFSTTAATNAAAALANRTGVNLDEEAARLLQFQQSYQAAAKFLQIAQSTFDTLLQTVGR